jgi:hypothetical protein
MARTVIEAQQIIQETLKEAKNTAKFNRTFGGFTLLDAMSMHPTLTREQAYEVMEYVGRRVDYDSGLSWYDIEFAAQSLFPGIEKGE